MLFQLIIIILINYQIYFAFYANGFQFFKYFAFLIILMVFKVKVLNFKLNNQFLQEFRGPNINLTRFYYLLSYLHLNLMFRIPHYFVRRKNFYFFYEHYFQLFLNLFVFGNYYLLIILVHYYHFHKIPRHLFFLKMVTI